MGHQRLNNELSADFQANIQDQFVDDFSDQSTTAVLNDESLSNLKQGINLLKNDSDWLTANGCFKFGLRDNQTINSKFQNRSHE